MKKNKLLLTSAILMGTLAYAPSSVFAETVNNSNQVTAAEEAKAIEDAHADAWEEYVNEQNAKQNIDTPTADDAKAEEDAHADAWEKAAQESMNKEEAMKDDATQESMNKEEAMKDDATQESMNKEEVMKGNTTQESMNQADTHTTRAQTLPETGQTHNSGLFGGIFLAIGLSLLVLSRRLNQK
ncbi:LPXTG cell wall anchor domain-containing protein [Staphylococcus felis]|uniref:LPXTG cell wall anchor domain-containing protein n=1 Tax=Staphylococcus felis TaxID=46127 RepID=UPI000E21C821|nr:LPXTG cell wall anchor domain-containing protein [Staphylococcus felis]REH77155.1 hypothetical protein DOS60_06095 [Staphylococcus felis]